MNNNSSTLSNADETLTMMEFAVHGVGVSCIAAAGIFCNALCLLVLCRPSLKKGHGSVNVILISMAAIDIMVSQKLQQLFIEQFNIVDISKC